MPMNAPRGSAFYRIDMPDSDRERPDTGDPVFARNLKSHRKAAKMSQARLGALIDREQNTISDWERARRKPEMPELRRLSKVLRVEIGELTGASEVALPTGASRFFDGLAGLPSKFWQRVEAMTPEQREQLLTQLSALVLALPPAKPKPRR